MFFRSVSGAAFAPRRFSYVGNVKRGAARGRTALNAKKLYLSGHYICAIGFIARRQNNSIGSSISKLVSNRLYALIACG